MTPVPVVDQLANYLVRSPAADFFSSLPAKSAKTRCRWPSLGGMASQRGTQHSRLLSRVTLLVIVGGTSAVGWSGDHRSTFYLLSAGHDAVLRCRRSVALRRATSSALLLAHLLGLEAGCFLPTCRGPTLRMRGSFDGTTLVCLSLISTTTPAPARYFVRRARRHAPCAKVLVGFWGLSPAELVAAQARIGNSADIATSLSDAVATVRTLASPSTDPDCSASPRLNRNGEGVAIG